MSKFTTVHAAFGSTELEIGLLILMVIVTVVDSKVAVNFVNMVIYTTWDMCSMKGNINDIVVSNMTNVSTEIVIHCYVLLLVLTLNICSNRLDRPVMIGPLLRVEEGSTMSLNSRCYALLEVK